MLPALAAAGSRKAADLRTAACKGPCGIGVAPCGRFLGPPLQVLGTGSPLLVGFEDAGGE